MSLDEIILALLGMVVSLLAYWAVRLESRVDAVMLDVDVMYKTSAETYVRKDDCRQTHTDVRERLAKIEEKIDRLIERKL